MHNSSSEPFQGEYEFNLRYPGQYFDKESGLHYNGFRTYDPMTGRYTQGDPIGLSGGWNRFGYAEGNPLRFIDPTGHIALVNDAVVLGAVGIGAVLMSPAGQASIKKGFEAISRASEDPCDEINRQIRDIAGKLQSKLSQQGRDQHRLFDLAREVNPGGKLSGKGTWNGHDSQITGLKLGLQRKIAEAKAAGCQVPSEFVVLAFSPNPQSPNP